MFGDLGQDAGEIVEMGVCRLIRALPERAENGNAGFGRDKIPQAFDRARVNAGLDQDGDHQKDFLTPVILRHQAQSFEACRVKQALSARATQKELKLIVKASGQICHRDRSRRATVDQRQFDWWPARLNL